MKLPVMLKTSPLLSCKRDLSVLCAEVWRGRVQGVAGSPKISLLISLRVLIKLKICMGLWCGHTSSSMLARELSPNFTFYSADPKMRSSRLILLVFDAGCCHWWLKDDGFFSFPCYSQSSRWFVWQPEISGKYTLEHSFFDYFCLIL